MIIGNGIGIQFTSGVGRTSSGVLINQLLQSLEDRSTYFENSSGTRLILQEFESCSEAFDVIQDLIDTLQSRSSYSENTTETYNILEELKNCE